jgi:GAF domain-containing protein
MAHDFGEALARAAQTIHTSSSLEDTLQTIAETAKDSLPGFDAVGISTIAKDGTVATRAGTSDLVWELDKLQYKLGQGPCMETLRDSTRVLAPKIADDDRWPDFVPRAVELGLRSQLALKLFLDDKGTVGGLNVYSTTTEEIDDGAVSMASLFAAHAATAMGNVSVVEGLQDALSTRTVIGVAVGMLMKEYTLSQDTAFGLLVRTSSHSNVKLRDIARRMVDEANAKASR